MTRFPNVSTLRLLLVAAACCLAVACGAKKTTVPQGTLEPDKLLYERGTAALNERKWFTAREYFRQIVDGYPQSTYRADSKLGLADAYLGEKSAESYVLAINEYREFLTFFPTHERADYAQYKLGMAYHGQMAKAERDQTNTKEAIKEFDAFFERFPNSSLAGEARARHREARDRLSESSYRVGVFYFRSRWYPGAIDRFKQVLKDDPMYTGRDAVYFYLAESLAKAQLNAEALPYYERLVAEFAQSSYLAQAQKQIAALKAAMALAPPAAPKQAPPQ